MLSVDFARARGAKAIVRGLRAISDFEYELELNQLNRAQAPDIESVYLMASAKYSFIRSSGVKELATFGGRIDGLVPEEVADGLEGTDQPLTKQRIAMDVLVLIDKLDDLVHNAKPMPLTDQVRVDKEEIYDILDQMRATIPEEIKQARWIVKERQEMLAEAKREAERIVKEARDRQERLVSEEEITKQAERAAEDIIEDARAREREIRLGAEDYADEILEHARGQPFEVHRRRAARPRSPRGQGRARRSRLTVRRSAPDPNLRSPVPSEASAILVV